MGKAPAFQFYVNDWLGSANIMLMTPAEEGAYIRLLAIAWSQDDCGLPDDDTELSLLSRLGEEWFNGGSTKIRKCFIQKGTRLYNKRLLEERKKQEVWSQKSRQGGIKSGRIRKNSKLNKERWLNDGSTVVEPNANSSSSFSLNNKELNNKDCGNVEISKKGPQVSHVRWYKNEMGNFVCSICQKSFMEWNNLQAHIKEHTPL